MRSKTSAAPLFVTFGLLFSLAGPGTLRAQHVDILVEQKDGKLVTGNANFETGEWTIGHRVFSSEFDDDFAVNSPGYNSLASSSPSMPTGVQALPGNRALGWDFLPMTIAALKSNFFYWNGRDSDGTPGLTPNDVLFGPLPGPNYSVTLFDKSGGGFTVNGSSNLVPGGIIDDTAADGSLHRHRFYLLQDGDGDGGTLPADGIYLFAMQMRMTGLTNSDPVFMVFGTPGSSIAALDSAAVPWLEQHVIVPGDYNGNGVVDAADYVVWRKGGPLLNEVDDLGTLNAGDYTAWHARFGNTGIIIGTHPALNQAMPEGPSWQIFLMLVASLASTNIRRRPRRL